jgi:hypothetical protein
MINKKEVKYGIIEMLCTHDLTEYEIRIDKNDRKIMTMVLEPKE